MFQLYAEWHLFERLGLGIRIQGIGVSETLLGPGVEFTTGVSVTSQLLTLQFIPFITDDGYVRIGLLGGIGPSTYEFTQTLTFGNFTVSESNDTSALAVLAGVYIDWGVKTSARGSVYML